jgi:glycosyltransferase involved in cell wall biosynthesis
MYQTIIIIPCYNEAARFPQEAIRKGIEENPQVLFLFVNDGSKDNTWGILQSLALTHVNVQVLNLEQNVGKAEAIRKAVLTQSSTASSSYIGYFDADLATPLSEIEKMTRILDSLPHIELVAGSRVRRMGSTIRRRMKRHLIGRIFATCASITLCLPVYDTQCGAKLMRVETAKFVFNQKFISKWLFDVEIFARLTVERGFPSIYNSIYEHPLEQWIEVGDSKLKSRDFLRFPLDLFRIYRRYHTTIHNILSESNRTIN